MKKTKIIATLGPATDDILILKKMISSGLDVIRLNFSHGSPQKQLQRIRLVRGLNKNIKIMQDLEGYRIRIGKLGKDIPLNKNSVFYLIQEEITGNEKEASFDYKGPLNLIKTGNLISIDDGKILLKVTAREKNRLKTKILVAGILKERKGINILDVNLPFDALTDKDKMDLNFGIKHKVDYIAQSFVRNARDILLIKDIIKNNRSDCKVFAKIENKEALRNIDDIIKESDGIVVARGDLGISLPIYKVPIFQKEIIKKCNIEGKPVVVATQMLETMTENNTPTRAEVSDVANAILDGAEYLMLSGETAIGKQPWLVVDMMTKIIKSTEKYQENLRNFITENI
ncbi:MAG: pyruvate kinase [bacterium]|nr:pyruvate kinase [bacterium]